MLCVCLIELTSLSSLRHAVKEISMKICGLGTKVCVNGFTGVLNKIGNEKIIGATIPYIVVRDIRFNICEIDTLEVV